MPISPGSIPAPVAGINSISSLAAMEQTDAIYTKNIDGTSLGAKVRPGYQEWANGFGGDEVKTIIPYKGVAADGSDDKLFACTSQGIYDITASTESPTLDHSWGITSSDAGWCSFEVFTNDAGARILMVTDRANGYRIYTESTDLWTSPTVTGPTNDIDDLVFVMVWKHRVWFIEKDTNSAWYTDVGVFQGTLTKFNFGNKFAKGGDLVSLHNWSLDSGIGPDDYLVALSSAGDVLVYAGTNPTAASTFGSVGVFYIGDLPAGRRVALPVGGDLYILSSYGVISAKDLLAGQNPFTFEGSISYKINPLLRGQIAADITSLGWELQILPDLAKIIVTVPKVTNQPHTQYVYDMNLKGWSIWEGQPMTTVTTWKNSIYSGAVLQVNRVLGSLDNVEITAPDPQPIYWSLLTAYNELGSPQLNKMVEFIRPRFVAEGAPSVTVKAFYDYDLSTLAQQSIGGGQTDVWDTGIWDTAIWGGGQDKFQEIIGANGMGKTIAIAMSGASTLETTLVDIGVLWKQAMTDRGLI